MQKDRYKKYLPKRVKRAKKNMRALISRYPTLALMEFPKKVLSGAILPNPIIKKVKQ